MKKYVVTVPIAGSYTVEVEAEDEDGAIEAAFEAQGEAEDVEWEALREICSGNVCHAPVWEVEVEEVK